MPGRLRRTRTLLCALTIAMSGCAGSEPEPQQDGDPPGPAEGTVHEYAYLEDEVRHLLEFLRGEAPLREDALADSVTLYVAPEGGGEMLAVAGGELLRPAAWRVGSHSLVPPADLGDTRLTPGLHSRCQAAPLETTFPDLADYPHVGVRLARDEAASCLQTWNATFVFDEDALTPRLIAVVYDQWEW